MMLDLNVLLPIAFMLLMGISMLLYSILDGYDLGVGMLIFGGKDKEQKDIMIGSIGPFWDANETWLVLGVGLLLVAFPAAHGIILTNLYLPVTIMILGLILRGVAFDFRVKAKVDQQEWWNRAFFSGSLIASLSQGYMLGSYILGFKTGLASAAFSLLVATCISSGYILLGACWLILKTSGELRQKAIIWAKSSLWFASAGIAIVSIVTPLVSERIFNKWFQFPEIMMLLPIPLCTGLLIFALAVILQKLPEGNNRWDWAPFATLIAIALLCFHGLAYSFYPYIVPDQMTIYDAASSTDSLWIIFIGAVIVLPILALYTWYIYRVFRGKAQPLSYDGD